MNHFLVFATSQGILHAGRSFPPGLARGPPRTPIPGSLRGDFCSPAWPFSSVPCLMAAPHSIQGNRSHLCLTCCPVLAHPPPPPPSGCPSETTQAPGAFCAAPAAPPLAPRGEWGARGVSLPGLHAHGAMRTLVLSSLAQAVLAVPGQSHRERTMGWEVEKDPHLQS